MENTEVKRARNIDEAFKDFGKRVRKEREQKGYSPEDISAHLKINLSIINAIEDGAFEAIPHFVYMKGFIRSYALFLGIKEYELRLFFQKIEAKEKESEEYQGLKKASRRYGLYVCFAVLFCVVGACFFYFEGFGLYDLIKKQRRLSEKTVERASVVFSKDSKEKMSSKNDQSFAPQVSEVAATSFEDKLSSPADYQKDARAEKASNNKEEILEVVEVEVKKKEPKAREAEKTQSPVFPKSQEEARPIHMNKPGQRNIVVLKGLEECWVHSTADAKETRQFSIQPGQLFALSFHDSLVLKLGNAGGVELKYNGEKVRPVGRRGQVKTVTFPLSQN